MTSKLKQYQILSTGLTQQDDEFRQALAELSGQPVDFYNYRLSAYNRLNHALVGDDIDLQHPVHVIGLLDQDSNQLTLDVQGQITQYNLDDLDPQYLSTINQANPNKKARQLPITDIASEMLDDLTPDVDPNNKPRVEPHSLSSSNEILRKSFANEMVFQAELQTFIQDNNLEHVMSKHSDKLTQLVDKKSFEASFNDGLNDLTQQVEKQNKTEHTIQR